MANSFIGKPISLVSHSDVRYRGILAGIDTQASTIQLSNVFSMGTENRRPPESYIPPVPEPYAYIIFRASEVKDLSVDQDAVAANQPPRRDVRDDPAVIGIGAPHAPAPPPPVPVLQQQPDQHAYAQQAPRQNPSTNQTSTATAAMQSVERALGDLRVAQTQPQPRGGRRGGRNNAGITVPDTDFDFEGANARFDKATLGLGSPISTPQEETQDVTAAAAGTASSPGDKGPAAYNPKASFFDSLSAGPANNNREQNQNQSQNRDFENQGQPNPRSEGRIRREEERERNISTFGEPGGVGLMGPGAYVGGWGRRGGRGRGRGGFGGSGFGQGGGQGGGFTPRGRGGPPRGGINHNGGTGARRGISVTQAQQAAAVNVGRA